MPVVAMGIGFNTPSDGQVINGVAHFVRSTAPSVRNDGSALQDNDRWYDLSTGKNWIRMGIYWVSQQVFTNQTAIGGGITVSGNGSYSDGLKFRNPLSTAGDRLIYVEEFGHQGTFNAPQDGSNYRTVLLQAVTSTTTTIGSTITTIGKTGRVAEFSSVKEAIVASRLQFTIGFVGTPGTLLQWIAFANYREIYQ